MKINEIEKEIKMINDYLGRCLWMDFEIGALSWSELLLYGAVDNTWNEFDIEIKFTYPYMLSSVVQWQLDDSKNFISLSNREQCINLLQNSVDPNDVKYIFEINAEDQSDTIKITAKGIKCTILNEKPF